MKNLSLFYNKSDIIFNNHPVFLPNIFPNIAFIMCLIIYEMIKGASRYYLQQFTERDTVPNKNLTAPSNDDMVRFLEFVKRFIPLAELRGL